MEFLTFQLYMHIVISHYCVRFFVWFCPRRPNISRLIWSRSIKIDLFEHFMQSVPFNEYTYPLQLCISSRDVYCMDVFLLMLQILTTQSNHHDAYRFASFYQQNPLQDVIVPPKIGWGSAESYWTVIVRLIWIFCM